MKTRRNMISTLVGVPLLALAKPTQAETIATASEAAAGIISYTLYGEARGEPLKGKLAVAAVIYTRSKLNHCLLAETCLKKRQFSCWNGLPAVPKNYVQGKNLALADARARGVCYQIAWKLLTEKCNWPHFTHFYNPKRANPSWGSSLQNKKTIGHHIFGYLDR